MSGDSRSAAPAGRRGIGLAGAIAIGIGGMVGGGIFAVLGEAVSLAHGATGVAFLVAGVIALLTASSYARLSVTFPSQGGTVTFIDHAFGRDLVTGTINLVLWLSYLVTLSLYAVAFGSYALTFFPGDHGPWLRHLLISVAIIVPIIINLFNAEVVSRSETLIVIIKLLMLLVVIVSGASHVDTARLNPDHWGTPFSIVSAGMVIFVAYEGFELIANSAQEIRDPGRNLPRAFYLSVLLVILLYMLIALVTVGTVPESRIAAARDYALAEAARPALGSAGFTLVAVSALLATFSAINATIYGNARLGYTLAMEGELPDILEHRAWNEPVWGVLVSGGLALVMANLIDLNAIAIIGSASFLLVFAVTNLAAARLAERTGGRRSLAMAACLACLAALAVLLTQTWHDSPHALGVFVSFIAAALVFELTYGRFRRKPFTLARGRRNEEAE